MTDQTIYLLGGRLRILQTPELYSPSEDAVWLAAAAASLPETHFFEAGFGTGAPSLCLLSIRPDVQISALELQPVLADIGKQNAALNGFEARLDITVGNLLTRLPEKLADHAMSNPPFHIPQKEQLATPTPRDIAHARTFKLEAWLLAMARHIKPEGALLLVTHANDARALRTFATTHGYGLQLVFLRSHESKPPKRVLVRLQRGLASHEFELNVFDADLRTRVLRSGETLFCWR